MLVPAAVSEELNQTERIALYTLDLYQRGYVSHKSLDTLLVPILHNADINITDVNHYRSIAVAIPLL